MTPLERAALALCENQTMLFLRDPANPSPARQVVKVDPNEWDELSDAQRDEFCTWARAVIAAIREPSEGMIAATVDIEVGVWPHDSSLTDNAAKAAWAMMIDALLAERK